MTKTKSVCTVVNHVMYMNVGNNSKNTKITHKSLKKNTKKAFKKIYLKLIVEEGKSFACTQVLVHEQVPTQTIVSMTSQRLICQSRQHEKRRYNSWGKHFTRFLLHFSILLRCQTLGVDPLTGVVDPLNELFCTTLVGYIEIPFHGIWLQSVTGSNIRRSYKRDYCITKTCRE